MERLGFIIYMRTNAIRISPVAAEVLWIYI